MDHIISILLCKVYEAIGDLVANMAGKDWLVVCLQDEWVSLIIVCLELIT